jgi:hypothetical protein
MIGAIKFARYCELGENGVVFTVFTDSIAMYQSRPTAPGRWVNCVPNNGATTEITGRLRTQSAELDS